MQSEQCLCYTLPEKYNAVKHVLSGHSKIDKTKILMTSGCLFKVKRSAECSHSAILLTCIKRLSVLIANFGLLFEWLLHKGFTVCKISIF